MRLVKYRLKWAAEWWEGGKRYRRSLGTDDRVAAQVALARFQKLREEAANAGSPVRWEAAYQTGRHEPLVIAHEAATAVLARAKGEPK